ncbi:CD320 antigen isoform 2-T3 [Alca torda]
MARILPLFLLLLVPLPVLLLPSPPPENAAGPRCPPGRFQCQPGAFCFPAEWRCDGHPDCEDEEDERGCGTATPDGAWVTPPRSSGVPPGGGAEASATLLPGGSVPSRSQDRLWILIIAAADLWLLANAAARQSPVLMSRPGAVSGPLLVRSSLSSAPEHPGSCGLYCSVGPVQSKRQI